MSMANSRSANDKIAMKVLLARVVRGERQKNRIIAIRKMLDDIYSDAEAARSSGVQAFSAFGFNPNNRDLWTEVRAFMGDADYEEGIAMARDYDGEDMRTVSMDYDPLLPPPPPPLPSLFEDDNTARVEELTGEDDEPGIGEEAIELKSEMPTIREIVLAQLAAAGTGGIKAAAIRSYIEQTYKHIVHEKTVGMTLYRLSNDKLARRDGRTWFSAKPTAETENPGGETPGSKDGQNEKEDA